MGTPFLAYPQFLELISGVQSIDKTLRNNYEKMLEKFVSSYPRESIEYLMQIIKIENVITVKIGAAVYLKNLLSSFNSQSDTSTKISITDQLQLRNGVLQTTVKEEDSSVRKNLIEVLVNIMAYLQPCEDENEFMSQIFGLFETTQPVYQETALMILNNLIPVMHSYFNNNRKLSLIIIQKCMPSEHIFLRCNCVTFLNMLMKYDLINIKEASACIPMMIETMITLKNNHDPKLENFLVNLEEIATTKAFFFKPYGAEILSSLNAVTMATDIEGTPSIALEVLLSIAETKPKMAQNIPKFIETTIEIILRFMLDIIDEKYNDWLETDEEIQDNNLYFTGEQSIGRLAKAFVKEEKTAKFFPTIFRFLYEFLNRREWHFNFVAIMSISQIVDYIPEEQAETHLNDFVSVLLLKLKDEDWRVRYAACHAIGLISLYPQPYVQENMQDRILPALINTFNDSVARVQSHALAAFINFTEEVSKSSLEPHVEHVMQHLYSQVINRASNIILEQAVSAIAVVAGVIQEDFKKYHSIIPYIISISQHFHQEEHRVLRGKAIECITIIGFCVGTEKFASYSHVVMDDLVNLFNQKFDDDNPVKDYVQLSINRMCRLMKTDFLPYIPKILPSLLNDLSEIPEISEELEEFVKTEDDLETMKRNIAAYDAETIDNYEFALDFIKTCAEVLTIDFADYLERCTSAIFGLFENGFASGVMEQTISTMAYLIKVARKIFERTGNKEFVVTMIIKTFNFLKDNIDESYSNETSTERYYSDFFLPETSAFDECLTEVGPDILTIDMVKKFTLDIFLLIEKSFEARESIKIRLNELKKVQNEGDEDEDEYEDLKIEIDQELDLCISLLDILGTFMKNYKKEYFDTSIDISTKFIKNCRDFHSTDDNGLTIAAILLSSDMFEHLEELIVPLWDDLLLPFTFNCIMSNDPRIRQPASYILGKAAKLQYFMPYADKATKALWSQTKAFSQELNEDKSATDTAYSALGQLVFNHFDAIENPYLYVQDYIKYLPLKEEEIEGKVVHKELMERFCINDQKLVGPEGSFKQRILVIFIEIFKTPFSTEELDKMILNLFNEVGQQALESLFTTLTDNQKQKLKTLITNLQQN